MQPVQRLCRLDNGTTINIANRNLEAKLTGDVILASRAEPKPSAKDPNIIQYTFSCPETGWFTNIRHDDLARLENVLANEEGDEYTALVINVHPIYGIKPTTLAKMKPAFPKAN